MIVKPPCLGYQREGWKRGTERLGKMALVAAGSPALAALLPALEEEHGPLTAAVEAQYLSLLDELPSLTIEGIRRRPTQAKATASGLQSQLLELANGSCAAFVESADCVKRVHEKMTRIANHLARLEAALPGVGTGAEGLLGAATSGIEARGTNTLLLSRLADVLDVLEQPQLMDACVRNGFVDDALELEAAVRPPLPPTIHNPSPRPSPARSHGSCQGKPAPHPQAGARQGGPARGRTPARGDRRPGIELHGRAPGAADGPNPSPNPSPSPSPSPNPSPNPSQA